MIDGGKRADKRGCTRAYFNVLCWALPCCTLPWLGCGTPARNPSGAPVGAASSQAVSPYVCDEAHDYRVFERSDMLASVNAHVPRREQTREQRETLTPGDPLWQLQPQPEVRCSADRFLELRYASVDAAQNAIAFADAPHRMTVTLAPGARLLDPFAHARMQRLAAALDEALTLLRTKTCSESGAPCELQRNADPLRFPGTTDQYALGSEFVQLGRRAWFWRFVKDERRVLRALFSTTDGRFDVEVLVETSAGGGLGALGSVPELLSDEYDRRSQVDGGGAQGGSHG